MTTIHARIGAAIAGAALLVVAGVALHVHDAVVAAHLVVTAFGLALIGIGMTPQRGSQGHEVRKRRT